MRELHVCDSPKKSRHSMKKEKLHDKRPLLILTTNSPARSTTSGIIFLRR